MAIATISLDKPKADAVDPSSARSIATRPPDVVRRSADPVRSTILSVANLQAKGAISSPDDAAEREADRVAAHVVSLPEPSAKADTHAPTSVMRSPLIVQRRAAPARRASRQAASGGNVMQQVKTAASGGFALSKKTRAYLEPRFKADFSNVRLHTDAKAKELSNRVGARAFTFGRHIFFNEGQYNPDSKAGLELLAHELTHTIQQRETIQRKPMVHQRTDPHVQRIFGALGDAVSGAIDAVGEFVGDVVQIVKDFVAEHADVLPGFKILCLVLGYNPINDAPAPGGGRAILKELTTFIPFGDKVFEALNNHGIIDKGGAFIDTQIANFKSLASAIIGAISSFFGSLGPGDALNPLGAWNRLKSSFTPVFASMKSFASGLISGFIDLVREVILKPMARWAAANIPHWDLLMGVLGVNPVSNDGESPTMQLIGAFMKLIGQDEVWENIKKGNAIARAWAWFQGALSGAKALVSDIPGLVVSTIKSLTIVDVLTVVGAAQKIIGAFASFAGKFGTWALGTVLDLLEIVLSVVAPTVIPYLKKAGAAFKTIVRNPGAFIGSLVAAGKLGFGQFAGNFVNHLKRGLIDWMTGSLGGAGVYIPQSFALRELLKFGLSVIGLTWANFRTKLVAATNEPTVVALEEGFKLVKTLVVEGPAAAWQQLLESLSNLKSMVMDAIIDYIKGKVVAIAIEKVLSMLTPAGAFIQAVLAIYRTITFIVGELRRIAAVVAAFIDGIAAIASGVIGPAANKVENVLARGLSLAISFLANFAGLGDISKKVLQVIDKIRAPVFKAMDKVVAWIVAQAKKLGRFILQAGTPADPNARLRLAVRDAKAIARGLGNRISRETLEKGLGILRTRYGLTALRVSQSGGKWFVEAEINPKTKEQIAEDAAASDAAIKALLGKKMVNLAAGGPATLAYTGKLDGYRINLGSSTDFPSIQILRRPAGSPDPFKVHINDTGHLAEGAKVHQKRSSEAEKLNMYRTVISTLKLGTIMPEVNAGNVTEAINSQIRGAMRNAIIDGPNYQSLSAFNTMISSGALTGPGMQGELFEAWVVKHFGQGISDEKVVYYTSKGKGVMDRSAGTVIVEVKSRVRPSGCEKFTDDEIPQNKFSISGKDKDQFKKYIILLSGAGHKKSGNKLISLVYTAAQYYFNFLGVAKLFNAGMPGELKSKTTFYLGGTALSL